MNTCKILPISFSFFEVENYNLMICSLTENYLCSYVEICYNELSLLRCEVSWFIASAHFKKEVLAFVIL